MATESIAKMFGWYVATTHVVYLVGLSMDSATGNITTLYRAQEVFGNPLLMVCLLVASLLAFSTAVIHPRWHWLVLIPQQILLIFSAWEQSLCIVRQSFADGVTRPFWFIATDQFPGIRDSVVHAVIVAWLFVTSIEKATKR